MFTVFSVFSGHPLHHLLSRHILIKTQERDDLMSLIIYTCNRARSVKAYNVPMQLFRGFV